MNVLKRLRENTRGAASIAPIYVIVSVVIVAIVASSMVTATTATKRKAVEEDMSAAARTFMSIAMVELTANGSNPSAAYTALRGTLRIPPSPHEPRIVVGTASGGTDDATINFTVKSPNKLVPDRAYSAFLRQYPFEYNTADGSWQSASDPAYPDRNIWIPVSLRVSDSP